MSGRLRLPEEQLWYQTSELPLDISPDVNAIVEVVGTFPELLDVDDCTQTEVTQGKGIVRLRFNAAARHSDDPVLDTLLVGSMDNSQRSFVQKPPTAPAVASIDDFLDDLES